MRYIKGLGAGLAGAVAGVVILVLVQTLAVAVTLAWQVRAGGSGSGSIGGVSIGLWPGAMIACVGGFAAGFWWQLRRR